jgi:hypothetical protein
MGADVLLAELRAADVRLWVDGDRLVYDAPSGVMTDDRLARLRADRDRLLAMLRRPIDPGRVRRCSSHLMPFDVIERPDPSRFGWVRFSCRRCGCFLGYGPR